MLILTKKLSKFDQDFLNSTKEIYKQNATLCLFGAQEVFGSFEISSELISVFAKLNEQITPLAKLNCMRQTIDMINDQMKKAVDDHRSPLDLNQNVVFIMSDDLIAAVICLLAHCQPTNFSSNIEFIHTFSWYLPQNSELGFSLVTFEVAKEYMQNFCNQRKMVTHVKQVPKENKYTHVSSSLKTRYSQFDQEIDKITQMLNDQPDLSAASPTEHKRNNPEELGGFLSSLVDDFSTISGQK